METALVIPYCYAAELIEKATNEPDSPLIVALINTLSLVGDAMTDKLIIDTDGYTGYDRRRRADKSSAARTLT